MNWLLIGHICDPGRWTTKPVLSVFFLNLNLNLNLNFKHKKLNK